MFNLQGKFAVPICAVATYNSLKYYIYGSLFFSKKAGMYSILECYMNGSLNFAGRTALHFRILQSVHFSF